MLLSKGCKAQVVSVKHTTETYIVAELCTATAVTVKGKKEYITDWKHQVLMYRHNGEILHKGDSIIIEKFYIRNYKDGKPLKYASYIITEWEIAFRNKYKSKYYKQSKEKLEQAAEAQKERIEAEMQAQDKELDELIQNINEDECPF